MQKLMKRFHKNQKGFTLVELMVVVVIIGVLIAIAIPIYNSVTTAAEQRAVEANVRILKGASTMYFAEYGVYPTTLEALEPFIEGTIVALQAKPVATYGIAGGGSTPPTITGSLTTP